MLTHNCNQRISEICNSENENIKQLGRRFEAVFCSPPDPPPPETLFARCYEIDIIVKRLFPSAFAEKYECWRQQVGEFQAALTNESYENFEVKFADMFSGLNNAWKMIMEFLIVLFMQSVNRLDREAVANSGEDDFWNAFSIYRSIFHKADEGEDISAVNQLTYSLLKLFRKLWLQNQLHDRFILKPLVKDGENFDTLFPKRFDSIILLFSHFTDETIRQIQSEQDPRLLENVSLLSYWVFLDIVDTMTSIHRDLDLIYIDDIQLNTDPFVARGISLSGISKPVYIDFILPPGYKPDSDRFQKMNLYLVDRKIGTRLNSPGHGNRLPLQPDVYINLTPLLLYTSFGQPGEKETLSGGLPDQKGLFILHRYNKGEEQDILKYRAFSGKRFEKIEKSETSRYYKRFEEYEAFLNNLTAYYTIIEKKKIKEALRDEKEKSEEFRFKFEKMWHLSYSHLASLLKIDLYDSNAGYKVSGEKHNENVKFIEPVYVTPKEAQNLEDFIDSDKRGCIIIGKSGMGKSNLLCKFFLEQRRERNLNIFIDARQLPGVEIKEYLEKAIAEKINNVWDLKEFDKYLEDIEEEVTVVIDAVNEFNNKGGAVGLMEKICEFIEAPTVFKNIKIIASCRNEIWDQYKTKIGRTSNVLNEEFFFTLSGDAVFLSSFEDENARNELYSRYQAYYKLNPGSYEMLSSTVRELIKQPFMMGLIAEIYSNRYADALASPLVIPKELDYFSLFKRLTDRKKEDAKRLFEDFDTDKQASFDKEYDRCLFLFGKFIYAKLTESKTADDAIDSKDKSDSLQIDQLDKHKDFSHFLNSFISDSNKTTVFTAIIQVGLVDRIYVDEEDFWGNKKLGRAYKFFHDQYTQFWLSAVFNREVLGNLKRLNLQSDNHSLNIVIPKIKSIIESSQNSPVLSGGLNHWLSINVFDDKKNLNECLTVLFNRLMKEKSNTVNYFVGSFLHWLIDANLIPTENLMDHLVKKGSPALRECFYEHILQIWPEFSIDSFQAILAHEKDDALIKEIADIFMNLFTLGTGEKVIEFLNKALESYENVSFGDIVKMPFELKKLKREFTFLMIFIISSFLCNILKPGKLIILRDFVNMKYRWVFGIITDKQAVGMKRVGRKLLHHVIRKNSTHHWKRAIATDGDNWDFFVKVGENSPRSMLRAFYPFCVDYHNGKMERLSLDKDSEYMQITLKMMGYNYRSICGYVATILLEAVLKDQLEKLDDIVDEIIKQDSNVARSYGASMMHMLAKRKTASIDHLLDIIHHKFFPVMKDHYEKGEYSIPTFFAIGATDFGRYWGKCEAIFSDMLSHIREKNDEDYLKVFEGMMINAFFPPDINIGVKICEYLLDKKMHQDPFWHDFTLKMLACMLAKDPKRLKQILDDKKVKDTLIDEAKPFLTEDIRETRTNVSYKQGWNNFIVINFSENKKLRYLLINYILNGLVQAESLEELSKAAPGLATDILSTFVMDDSDYALSDDNLTIVDKLSHKWTKKQTT